MLPKVATTILHSSSRAASAVQNQSSTIRNVLQFQSNSGPNSNRGGNGPSSGGYKYNAGSKSYHSSGRAVSQAGIYEVNDGGILQTDDNDDLVPQRPTVRARRHSTSLTLTERAEQRRGPLGVLNAVKIHARSRHAFAVDSPVKTPSRRNSLSAVDAPSAESLLPPPPPPRKQATPPPPPSGAHRQTSTTPSEPEQEVSYHYTQLINARNLEAGAATAVVMDFRKTTTEPTVPEFNAALDVLLYTRVSGEPLTLILETYNDMVSRGLVPNLRTYIIIIMALTDRDNEVQWQISAIEQRQKWAKMGSKLMDESLDRDQSQLKLFREENNVSAAMNLFRAMTAVKHNPRSTIPGNVFRGLLRSCAMHAAEPGMVASAIQVWSHMERFSPNNLSHSAFVWMINMYANLKDTTAAQLVFSQFQTATSEGRVSWGNTPCRNQTIVWNEMIDAYFQCELPHSAISLVDDMMEAAATQEPDERYKVCEDVYAPKFRQRLPPPPSIATFYSIINGFIVSGDVTTAWTWFQKLITLPTGPTNVDHYQPTLKPVRPNNRVWRAMISALAERQEVDKLNELILQHKDLMKQDGIQLRGTDLSLMFASNMDQLVKLGEAGASYEQMKPYVDTMLTLREEYNFRPTRDEYEGLSYWLVANGFLEEGVALCDRILRDSLHVVGNISNTPRRSQLVRITTEAYTRYGDNIPFSVVVTLANLAEIARYTYPLDFTAFMLQVYSRQSTEARASLDVTTWVAFMKAALCLDVMPPSVPLAFCPSYSFAGSFSLLEDMKAQTGTFDLLDVVGKSAPSVMSSLLTANVNKMGEAAVREGLERIGCLSLLDEYSTTASETASEDARSTFDSDSAPDTASTSPMISPADAHTWTPASTSEIQELLGMAHNRSSDPRSVYQYFCALLDKKKVPPFTSAAKVTNLLQRSGHSAEVHRMYELMQPHRPDADSPTFHEYLIFLDSMIPAHASIGALDRAHEIRNILLAYGSAPTADSYGALIFHVKETADDAANALALFHESKLRGVPSSAYLYNNIISKVGRARKADLALEMFNSMKAEGIQPSSITYGALIGACVRVGDAASAELLFSEMREHPNFRPRIPPYNTMMQLYTTTKPNQERALYYYEELKNANIVPSSYTYKLLIDAYMLEPHNIEEASKVFSSLLTSKKNRFIPKLEGQHVAAMLNAYGCIRKNLQEAMDFFESSKKYFPGGYDAVVYEAMFNVITVHRRPDLISVYLAKMVDGRVHMTAYVVNVVIRAFAVAGDIEQARNIFASLQDPPKGLAALYNHAPHSADEAQPVDADAPVYREPSTWEAMIRAELGHGHRDHALHLLERLKEREYPEGVFNRISGILVDHSALPPP